MFMSMSMFLFLDRPKKQDAGRFGSVVVSLISEDTHGRDDVIRGSNWREMLGVALFWGLGKFGSDEQEGVNL